MNARAEVSRASVVVQSDGNQFSRREATLGGTETQEAHALQTKQEQLLRQFAQSSIILQKQGAAALEITIYSGAKAEQIRQVADSWKSSLEQNAGEYSHQIEHGGQRLRALIDAPTLSSDSPLRVDKAGTVVIAANFGERGSVSAVWKDGTEAKVHFEVSAAGTINWTANAAGPSIPAEQRDPVRATGPQVQLEVLKAGEAVESTHQSQKTEKVQDGGIRLTGSSGTLEAGFTGQKKTGGSLKIGGGVTGDATLSPSTEQTHSQNTQERISRELSRSARIMDFRIETWVQGSRVDIEQEDRRRNRQ